MLVLILLMGSALGIVFLLAGLASFFALKQLSNANKSSPFECGFLASTRWRPSFSLHFFLVALIFLIFDVELVILFPCLMLTKSLISVTNMLLPSFILVLITLGTLFEWNQQGLEWAVLE